MTKAKTPPPPTIKHGTASKSFINRVLKLDVYGNIDSIFF